MTAIFVSSSHTQSSFHPRVFGARPFHTDGELLALRYATDGSLWSVEEPGVLRHWDVRSRQQIGWSELGTTEAVWCLSGAAHYVAAGNDELCLWESGNGELLAFWQQTSWTTALAFQPGGLLLASGHDDGGVRLWDYTGGRLAYEIRPPVWPSDGSGDLAVSALAFSPDGRRLAVATEDRSVFLWSLAGGELLGRLVGHTDRISAMAWHPDGRRLVSAGWDATARVWDATTGVPLILLNSHESQVHALAFSHDGQYLACADAAPAIHLWDMKEYQTIAIKRDHVREVCSLAFSLDGQQLVSGGVDRVIHVEDVSQHPIAPTSDKSPLAGTAGWSLRTCLAVTDAGGRLASLGRGTPLRVWDTKSAKPVVELEDAPHLRAFAASADGRWFAGALAQHQGKEETRRTLILWRADNGRRECLLEGQAAPITQLAFRPDSTLLASAGSRSSDVWLWTIPDGKPLLLPDVVQGCVVEALAFHPHAPLLAVAGVDWLAPRDAEGRVVLWDLLVHQPSAILPGGATSLAFHPSGDRLAVVTPMSQTIVIWDVASEEQAGELVGHLDAVVCLAYSPDGRWLASGSDDRTLRLWDADSGELRGLMELDTQIKALAFSPDGHSLFTGNGTTSCYQLDVRLILPAG